MFLAFRTWSKPRLTTLLFWVLCGLVLAIRVSHLGSSYHLEVGARILQQIQGTNSDEVSVKRAIAHLTAVPGWDDGNPQVYRLLGQAYVYEDDAVEASQALSRLVEIEPRSPIGWWELGLLYEKVIEGSAVVLDDGTRASVTTDTFNQMVNAWQLGGFTSSEFLGAGEEARKAAQYSDAVTWYKRASVMAPALGDPWYYIGLVRQAQGRWAMALEAYSRALQADVFQDVGRSDVYFRQGVVYQGVSDYQDLRQALILYDVALEIDSFSSDELKAQAFYKRGEVYGLLGRTLSEVIAQYRQALTLRPNHRWARLRLGYALYWKDGELGVAKAEIERALAIWPNNAYRKWPYRYLGDIYRDAGLVDKAVDAYQEALRIDPNDTRVKEILASLVEE